MMSLSRQIRLFLQALTFPKIPSQANRQASIQQNIRNIVARVSSGNVSLASGRFFTKSDLAELYKEVENYDFTKSK